MILFSAIHVLSEDIIVIFHNKFKKLYTSVTSVLVGCLLGALYYTCMYVTSNETNLVLN